MNDVDSYSHKTPTESIVDSYVEHLQKKYLTGKVHVKNKIF